MRLLVEGEFLPAGGIIGAGFDELAWPVPARAGAGDELHVRSEILSIRRSKSRPMQAVTKVHNFTITRTMCLPHRGRYGSGQTT
jgi:acyl dehydratase